MLTPSLHLGCIFISIFEIVENFTEMFRIGQMENVPGSHTAEQESIKLWQEYRTVVQG